VKSQIVQNQLPEKISQAAAELDNAIENKDLDRIMSGFSDDCEIELLGIKLTGKKGLKKWIDWMYAHLAEIKFEPITIMVDGNVFFEEFILKGRLHDGTEVQSKQAEILIYENYQVKNLRLYFDRLDFADSLAKGVFNKALVRKIAKESLKGLE
jgi:ketosteroid isomerase-like protein